MTHEQLIAACTQWFWNEFPQERRMLYAINNNISEELMKYVPKEKRAEVARQVGAKNKAKGVVAGVLDLCYITYDGRSVYFDGKIGTDTLSAEQIDFCEKLEDRGMIYFSFETLEEFKLIIDQIQNG